LADVRLGQERVPVTVGRALFDYADDLAVAVPASCQRSGRCHECVVEVLVGADALSARTTAEDFLPTGYRLACQAVIARPAIDVEFAVLRRTLRILLPSDESMPEIDALVRVVSGRVQYGDDDLGPFRGGPLGVALDVGTTTVVLELVHLGSGRVFATGGFENPQRFGGSDVMTRISYEATRPGELRRALRRALNQELRRIFRDLAVDRRAVCEVLVVGNSTMRDLFFGLDVGPIGRYPYRSVTETQVRIGAAPSTWVVRLAHELGIYVHPRARIVGAPLVASHVGADAAADLVAIDADRSKEAFILIDVGTNTEVIVGSGTRLVAASCPAGPAFEGGLVRASMAAAEGAIEAARLDRGVFSCRTIGDKTPQGICGSGLIDVLAELRKTNQLTVEGRFTDGSQRVTIVPEARIELSREDVSHLAQAKAANAAGQQIALRAIGLNAAGLDRVYLAGGFANAIDVANAISIGFLAPVPVERVVRVGNAAVRGAKRLLLSRHRRDAIDRLVRKVEHVELEKEQDFFDLFVEGCRFEPLG
jgi:uncharacterized 2Fe-2S/4Fe-4S cluster protein (DUF4445 family)